MKAISPLFLSKALISLLILCLGDAIFTDVGLHLHLIEEMNPLIRHIYEWNTGGYYAVKLALPLLLMILYPRIRTRLWVKPCLALTVLLYGAVNVYHLIWLSYGWTYIAKIL
ncbi:DUF5658 family protein [Paenibacillus sp. N3.4]|uniref:DUF5658 family protein n=1 Tax=Paenibacillus sp. N3.4 TaxID=2603222 RepID=UPI0011C99A69|nr:DUF5658 family protein [Paenibacillus sp. N3.4]TXK84489.1 hypothetical protein FU659_08735 [Paenibacillus sp. N3.4]